MYRGQDKNDTMLGEIRDLRSKPSRTSAQLADAMAREDHRGNDPGSSRSLGGRQDEGVRTQSDDGAARTCDGTPCTRAEYTDFYGYDQVQDFPRGYSAGVFSAPDPSSKAHLSDELLQCQMGLGFVNFYGVARARAAWRAAGPQLRGGRPASS